ncbi:hypothetical protein VSVS12_02539 [Vibrio scophthalmi]|uniref:DUF5363 family protein n=1 Tax=Vibrio scophthalmi TaxID=45658 RepID=UPI0008099B58|nr:DUF5363 family protein [Vibrio scophthalmi]ANS86295.1 hypothetical protein VSVS12_02539 [Vibrio scophthalmi]
MWAWFTRWLKKYDQWCQSMGLTPEQKRSCVAYRAEPGLQEQPKPSSKAQQ